MKKILLIIFVLVCFLNHQSYCQYKYLDSSFNKDGVFQYRLPGVKNRFGNITNIAIQSDGKIVSAGYYNEEKFVLVSRVTAKGYADTAFGSGGFITFQKEKDPRSYYPVVTDMFIQPDQKILVLGYTGPSGFAYYHTILLRLNDEGSLDKSFGKNGSMENRVLDSINFRPIKMTLQKNGKILIAGQENIYFKQMITRLNSNGIIDSGFGENGIVMLPSFNAVLNVQTNSQGKIICSGSGIGSSLDRYFLAAAYLPNGQPDTTFGQDGIFSANIFAGRSYESAGYLKILQGDKILLGGTAYKNEDTVDVVLVRCNANGKPDKRFGQNGCSSRKIIDKEISFTGMAIDNNGKLVTSVSTYSNDALFSFNKNGSIDSMYGTNGQLSFNQGKLSEAHFFSIAFQPDNKLVLGGNTYQPYPANIFFVMRLKNNLSPAKQQVNNNFASLKTIAGINVFPNPAHDHLYVSGLKNIDVNTINIVDNTGKPVMLLPVQNNSDYTINISKLQPGIYYIRLVLGSNSIKKKFIKE